MWNVRSGRTGLADRGAQCCVIAIQHVLAKVRQMIPSALSANSAINQEEDFGESVLPLVVHGDSSNLRLGLNRFVQADQLY
jgi:hypothetical protein